ncbi:MAG: hypothetical protein LIO70_01290 [Clostridiales bacterium]|nr:hypothetical protein [Clostridiales bacterium]
MQDMTTSELQERFEAAKADNDRMRANLRTKEQTNENLQNEVEKLTAKLKAEAARGAEMARDLNSARIDCEDLENEMRKARYERDAYKKVIKWMLKSKGGEQDD